jgi:Na+-driven multidrug efflux pump
LGQTKVLLFSQAAAAISNIILNYILVFGKMGAPAMGYQGSATATVISEFIALLVLLGYLAYQSEILNTIRTSHSKEIQFSFSEGNYASSSSYGGFACI